MDRDDAFLSKALQRNIKRRYLFPPKVPPVFTSREERITYILEIYGYMTLRKNDFPYAAAIQSICYSDTLPSIDRELLFGCIGMGICLEEASLDDCYLYEIFLASGHSFDEEGNEKFRLTLKAIDQFPNIYLETPDRMLSLFWKDYLSLEMYQKILLHLCHHPFEGKKTALPFLQEREIQPFLSFEKIVEKKIPRWKFLPHQEDDSLYQGAHSQTRRWVSAEDPETYIVKTYGNQLEMEAGIRELYSLTIFDHPNIVKCHGWSISEDFTQIQFFLEDGGEEIDCRYTTLKWLKKYTPQILRALRHIHTRGFAYRDLKTPNLVFRRGKITLIDFGMVRRTNCVGGSPYMMSFAIGPAEIFAGSCIYWGAVDIWSLGMLLYVLTQKKYPLGVKGMASYRGKYLYTKAFLEQLTPEEELEFKQMKKNNTSLIIDGKVSDIQNQKLRALIKRCFSARAPSAGELLQDPFFE